MRTLSLTILGFLLVAVPAAATDGYGIIGSTTSQTANRLRTEMTVQMGDNPLDQFKMIRLARRIPTEDLKGSILMVPTYVLVGGSLAEDRLVNWLWGSSSRAGR